MVSSITITDVGPIHSLVIPIQPGVTVLRGASELGKSLALEAVSRLAGGKGEVTCRDKAAVGSVEGLGVRISVRQSVRRAGELEAVSIEGIDISGLVSPPIKDPAAADRYRIKELLTLTGVKADISMFSVDQSLLSAETIKCDDLVEMAAKVKKDLEGASRRKADAAEKEEGFALGCEAFVVNVDFDADSDPDVCQAALEDAILHQGRTQSSIRAQKEAISKAATAREKLLDARAPDLTKTKEDLDALTASETEAQESFDTLRRQFERAGENLAKIRNDKMHADIQFRTEKSHAETVNGWRETIEAAANIELLPDDAQAKADAAVVRARQSIETAAMVRQARSKAAEAKEHRELAKSHRKAADALRDAAKATDDVLSQAVSCDWLTIKAGRIVTQHPERGEVFFSDRSDGTRYKLAIAEVVKRIRSANAEKTAVVTVHQGAWGELQPKNKQYVSDIAKEAGICIVTIEATDDEEIRAEAFDANDPR